MDYRFKNWMPSLLGSGVLVGALAAGACGDSSPGDKVGGGSSSDDAEVLKGSSATGLLQAKDCPDLLTKIQDDAVMKVKLSVAVAKELGFEELQRRTLYPPRGVGEGVAGADGDLAGAPLPPTQGNAATDNGGAGGGASSEAGGSGTSGGVSEDPTGASDTNTQVEGVDEADFVKVVDNGKAMFLLQGNKLYKLSTWPAADLSLDKPSLKVEGQPTEMFVSADGKAVIFSSVSGYAGKYQGGYYGGVAVDYACGPYGGCCGGGNFIKITVADVSGDTFETVRELYYEGWYVSSRRYETDKGDVVRAVLQAQNSYSDLFTPQIEWSDAWGRPYAEDVLQEQLEAWAERSEAAIRNTKLSDWLPVVQEGKDGKLNAVEPTCEGYYVPRAGLSEYGLTHVLSLSLADADAPIGGVTIMGAAQTVYSNQQRMVLAQPDYRWGSEGDFGFVSEQRTALHAFAIDGAETKYQASGWVPGFLPQNNPQFGIDEQDGVIRVATTGSVRDNPKAEPGDKEFWASHTENRVLTLEQEKDKLSVIGKSDSFGDPGESTTAARFVGNRAYAVTFLQKDPLVVVDLSKKTAPEVLGGLTIPGFSQYMHPLDENHLITLGNSGNWGAQLQLFDVTDPLDPKVADTLDFGEGSSSEGQYNHKAFTFFEEKKLLALPLYSYRVNNAYGYSSTLQVVKVDAQKGFDLVGAVDHTDLFKTQAECVKCDDFGGCYYQCSYQPEMRRGHFVSGSDATYVYAFSYAGVTANEIGDLSTAVGSATLPAPQGECSTWYAGLGGGTNATQPGSAPSAGSAESKPEPQPPTPTDVVDAGAATGVDLGVDADAGTASST